MDLIGQLARGARPMEMAEVLNMDSAYAQGKVALWMEGIRDRTVLGKAVDKFIALSK